MTKPTLPTPGDIAAAQATRPHLRRCYGEENKHEYCDCGATRDREAIARAIAEARAEGYAAAIEHAAVVAQCWVLLTHEQLCRALRALAPRKDDLP